jgi:hypothetical protein
MGTITKWFIAALTTATQRNKFPSRCAEFVPLRVTQLEIALDAQRPIVSHGDFHRHSNLSSLRIAALVDHSRLDEKAKR